MLANHFMALNNARRWYIEWWLVSTSTTALTSWETPITLHLRANGIGTIATRTVKNDKEEDVQQQTMISHVLEEYAADDVTMFNINKAIYDKLNLLVTFDLEGDHAEYTIYES